MNVLYKIKPKVIKVIKKVPEREIVKKKLLFFKKKYIIPEHWVDALGNNVLIDVLSQFVLFDKFDETIGYICTYGFEVLEDNQTKEIFMRRLTFKEFVENNEDLGKNQF